AGPTHVHGVRVAFTGVVTKEDGQLWATDPFEKKRARLPPGAAQPGAVAKVAVHDEGGEPVATLQGPPLAQPKSARAEMFRIAFDNGLDPTFPPAVLRETEALLAAPGIDDPSLRDLSDKPFITIDNEDSKDLDQAMYIERNPQTKGHEIFY